jgi:hypothetical protein
MRERLVSGRDSLRHSASIDWKKGQKEGSKRRFRPAIPRQILLERVPAALKK